MMFTQVAEIIHKWMGWCPNAPHMHTASTELSTPQVTAQLLEPDGGVARAGRIAQGTRLAVGGMRILFRNKQLLWYSLLTGCAILFMFVAYRSLLVYGSYPYPAIAYPVWLALVFGIQLVTIFCLYFLLAGIIMSVSPGLNGKPVILRAGVSGARSYLRSLAGWSVILALVGTVLYGIILQYYWYPITALSELIYQFPFYFILRPEILGTGPIGGDSHVLSAVTFTLFTMIVNFVFFLLTLFVVPLIVFEKKRLFLAVSETVSLTKKIWGEILVCFCIF
ncbi:MAG: hypothetical protein NTZ39_11310, partial [Methanoregula sp.]|nr:hypothetical protein [Methanoregula sp.]